MQDIGSRLGPVRTDVPPARRELALALRAHFARLEISVRRYADQQALTASAISRYLSATNLPPEDFVTDLIHEVANVQGEDPRDEATRVLSLHRAAQDAQPGSWGHTKRLKQEAAKARDELRAAELDKRAAVAAHDATLSALNEAQEALDGFRGLTTGDRARRPGGSPAEHSFLQLELERSQTELEASRALLETAERRIAQLELEVSRLKDPGLADSAPMTTEWQPWYRPDEHRHPYWRQYTKLLEAKGWSPAAIASVDVATDHAVRSLADPSTPNPYQARGMVLAYVQSGATAHIAGLIAKTIDVGYRLVIVLSGASNSVRQQLQQHLDDELQSLPDTAGIIRLTSPEMDYQRLAKNLSALMFEKRVESRPLFGPENIGSASVRLMVVKKNKAVLTKLVRDLTGMGTPLDEVPALVVDADASHGPDSQIDETVARLLAVLPRAQYVSLATSPFTPALTNPDMPAHTFPRDFVVSLPRPDGYVGARELFTIDDPASSTGPDFVVYGPGSPVRQVDPDRDGLLQALDMFVLTGALKAYRESTDGTLFPHHLMLVQGSIRRTARDDLRARIDDLWRSTDYHEVGGEQRLRRLFESEFLQPRGVRPKGGLLPASFADLQPGLRTALVRLSPGVSDAVGQETGWKIVIVGRPAHNLLLGEAPTITYVNSEAGDTATHAALRQSFGRRPGYEDLVRFYLSRSAAGAARTGLQFVLRAFHQNEDAARDALIGSDLEPALGRVP